MRHADSTRAAHHRIVASAWEPPCHPLLALWFVPVSDDLRVQREKVAMSDLPGRENFPGLTNAPSLDGTESPTGSTAAADPGDVSAVLAQLRETISNLDALLASVQDAPALSDED
jgi:hypothetical protein